MVKVNYDADGMGFVWLARLRLEQRSSATLGKALVAAPFMWSY